MDNSTLGQLVSVGMWIAVSALVLLVVFVIYLFRSRVEQTRRQEAMADAQFEAQILGYQRRADANPEDAQELGFAAAPVAGLPTTPVNWDAVLNPPAEEIGSTHIVPQPEPTSTPTIQPGRSVSEDPSSAVLLQLQRAGIIHDIEGHMELNGNPRASAMLKLKDGKRALLVSYFETEMFTVRNLKRFDMLIYVDRNGRAVVIDSLENFIAGRVTSYMR